MSNNNSLSPPELDDRIAILQDNIRELVEQAAGRSGGQTEERNSDRIASRATNSTDYLKSVTPY